MTKKDIIIDNQINKLELLARKAKVIAEDLDQDYFGEKIENSNDFWRIVGIYYEAAGLKAGIVNDFLYDIINQLAELQKIVSEKETDANGEA